MLHLCPMTTKHRHLFFRLDLNFHIYQQFIQEPKRDGQEELIKERRLESLVKRQRCTLRQF